MDLEKELLLDLSIIKKNIPEWQKQLWIELMQKTAKETWSYEKIIKEYSNLRQEHYKLQEQYEKIKDSGSKNIKMEENILDLKSENNFLKSENNSLKNENIQIKLFYEKIKDENTNLLNSLLKAKELEAELQNKIFELEMKIQNKK
jgi:hypothetical protein